MQFLRHISLALVVIMSCYICASAWAADRPPGKVRIAVSSTSLGILDTWAAKERGFFRKLGVAGRRSAA